MRKWKGINRNWKLGVIVAQRLACLVNSVDMHVEKVVLSLREGLPLMNKIRL